MVSGAGADGGVWYVRGGERADCGDGGGCGIVVEGRRAERGWGGPPSGGVTEAMAP